MVQKGFPPLPVWRIKSTLQPQGLCTCDVFCLQCSLLESHVAHTFLYSGPFRKASCVAPCPDQPFSHDPLLLYPDSLFFITLTTYYITLHRAHFPSIVPLATVSSAGTSAGCACSHYCIPGVWHSTRKWTLLFSR